MSGTFTPAPAAAALWRMVLAQALLEVRLLLRHGEQLLLSLGIPVLVLLGGARTSVVDLDGASGSAQRLDALVPGVLALAVMSTAFTGQAIATAYERRYGALRLLATTPLPRGGLLAGKVGAVLLVELLQVAVVVTLAVGLGWQPQPAVLPAAAVLVAGTAAFTALALLLAGALRAEAVLAGANLLYLLLLVGGGIVLPVETLPAWLRPLVAALPSGALGEGLRAALGAGSGALGPFLVLLAWAVVGGLLVGRTFRWD